MLFEKKIAPRCEYCIHGSPMEPEAILCAKKGVVPGGYRCRAFRYDPLKRVPLCPAPPRTDTLTDADFSL